MKKTIVRKKKNPSKSSDRIGSVNRKVIEQEKKMQRKMPTAFGIGTAGVA